MRRDTVYSVIGIKTFNGWSTGKALTVGVIAFIISVSISAAAMGSVFYIFDWFDGFIFSL
jgi:hypothetical protein